MKKQKNSKHSNASVANIYKLDGMVAVQNAITVGLQMISKCGFSQRNIVIAALSLSVGLGFTQCENLFAIFPQIIQTVFAQKCVAVVFCGDCIKPDSSKEYGSLREKVQKNKVRICGPYFYIGSRRQNTV